MEERICTLELADYRGDLKKLVDRRMKKSLETEAAKDRIRIRLRKEGDMAILTEGIYDLLYRDLPCLLMAERIGELPVDPGEKRRILAFAIQKLRELKAEPEERKRILSDLKEHFSKYDHLDLWGYLRFRMRKEQENWEILVLESAQETLLRCQCREILRLFYETAHIYPPHGGEIYLVLNPDGSCTLTDDLDSRIRFEDPESGSLLNALLGLSPTRITIYDLSGGDGELGESLARSLLCVFPDRVHYFK